MTDSAEITDAENIIQKVNTLLDSSSPEDLEIAAKLLENIETFREETIKGRAKYLFGVTLFKLQEFEKALLKLNYLFEEDKDPKKYIKGTDMIDFYFILAICYRKTGNSEKASEYRAIGAKRKGGHIKNQAREFFESRGYKITFKKNIGPKYKIDLWIEKRRKNAAIWFAQSEIEVEDIVYQSKEVSELVKDKYIVLLSAFDKNDLENISQPAGFNVILSFDEIVK